MRKLFAVISLLACAALLGTSCGSGTSREPSDGDTTVTTGTVAPIKAEDVSEDAAWEEEDKASVDVNGAVVIMLSDSGSTASGNGVTIDGSVVTVTAGGVYVVSGTLSDGQLRVQADGATVTLVLDGVDIHSESTAPLFVCKAEKAILTLADGSQNRLSDSTTLVYEDEENQEPSAALFSKADLVINGGGALAVDAVFNDGIVSRDGLKIAGGDITVTAADDALMGRDYVLIGDGSLTLDAGGDGVKSTNDAGDTVGFVAVEGGTLAITSGADGIQAQTMLTVTGGALDITANGGSANGSANMGNDFGWGWMESTTATDSTGKGLKAGTTLSITGGTVRVDAADDALHSNDALQIGGGEITAAAGDDGAHADALLTITAGKLTITTCYEGLEAATISVEGGETRVAATDDGVNASSGSTEAEGDRGGMGGDPFAADSSMFYIKGGILYVDAQGDGLDSNGSIEMTGGTVYVCGPANSGNGTFDYASRFDITGGSLIAVGTTGMAQTPSSNTQSAVVWGGCALNSGSSFTVTAADGTVVMELSATRTGNWAYVTSPSLAVGENYMLSCDGSSQTITVLEGLNTIGNVGGMGGGPGGMGGGPGGGRPGGWW